MAFIEFIRHSLYNQIMDIFIVCMWTLEISIAFEDLRSGTTNAI